MNEAKLTTQFKRWSKHILNKTFVAECKICKKPSLPFSEVKEHQENSLYMVKHDLFNWKISDFSRETKPFDLFQMKQEEAYVVIFWYHKRGDRRITMIPIDNWLDHKDKSARKSITYDEACKIGHAYTM